MDVVLYQLFYKRLNSTKQPDSDTTGITISGELRDQCSIMHPIIRFLPTYFGAGSPDMYTYAYIQAFGRYYWVTDWSWINGRWEAQLTVDVLATYKTSIGACSAYVSRAASDSNGDIVDTFYPAKAEPQTFRLSVTTTWANTLASGGCYVMGIIGPESALMSQVGGAVTYYVLTPVQMHDFMEYLLSANFLNDNGYGILGTISQIGQEAAKALVNPMQYITSCYWYPISATQIGGSSTVSIKLGLYNFITENPTAYLLTATCKTELLSVTVPEHPQAATRGAYLNYSPYTRLQLHVQPFGTIPIDPSKLSTGRYLEGLVYVDLLTGKCSLRITSNPDSQHIGSGAIVLEMPGQFGIPIELAQISTDFLNVAAQVLSLPGTMIGAGGSSSGVFGLVGAAAEGINSAIHSLMPQIMMSGVNGSFIQQIVPALLSMQCFPLVDENNADFGRPLCETKVLNTLSGFIQCLHADIITSCFDAEKREIEMHMIKGFFYE